MAFLDPPELPAARAGRFHPSQPQGLRVPGYSCAHCGCLVVTGFCGMTVHAWNRGVFCDWRRGDFRLARVCPGELP